MSESDFNAERLVTARRVFEQVRMELGEHLTAAAVYGSVAHDAASAASDVELVFITDETVPFADEYRFEQGIMVEYTVVSAVRMLEAAHRVGTTWGIEADQYRHHHVLWDRDGFFPRLWQTAASIPDASFVEAERVAWWRAYEGRGKFHNAVRTHDLPRVYYTAWQFAYTTALRIALHERRPYESGRTIWTDAAARGYSMASLLAALTDGDRDGISAAIARAWEETRLWGQPE